jgi:hypothetical protein
MWKDEDVYGWRDTSLKTCKAPTVFTISNQHGSGKQTHIYFVDNMQGRPDFN